MIQGKGHTRLGDNAAAATAVTGIVSVRARVKSALIRPEPTWDDDEPAPELGRSENEVELIFKSVLDTNTFNQKLLDARTAGKTQQVFCFAITNAAISATNPLYSTTIALVGVEVGGGRAGQENLQTWVYPCGAISSTTSDPAA